MSKSETKVKRKAKIHIYRVEYNDEVHMVKTTSRAKAIKHFNRDIKASIPSQEELVELIKNGVVVEEAGTEE